MFYIRSSVKAKKNNNNKIALDPDVRREAADVGGDEGASNKPLKLGADECLSAQPLPDFCLLFTQRTRNLAVDLIVNGGKNKLATQRENETIVRGDNPQV